MYQDEEEGEKMPTETFMNLPQDKQSKILQAAKQEFSRVPFEETSIKRIVEMAGIARGSFYQYFLSKEDLLRYMMKNEMEQLKDYIQEQLVATNGDIFALYIHMYDYIIDTLFNSKDIEFHKRIFENMKASEDSSFIIDFPKDTIEKPLIDKEFMQQIDTSKLKVHNEEDLQIIVKMLFLIIRKALASTFRHKSKEEARREYIKMIEYLKQGVLKE